MLCPFVVVVHRSGSPWKMRLDATPTQRPAEHSEALNCFECNFRVFNSGQWISQEVTTRWRRWRWMCIMMYSLRAHEHTTIAMRWCVRRWHIVLQMHPPNGRSQLVRRDYCSARCTQISNLRWPVTSSIVHKMITIIIEWQKSGARRQNNAKVMDDTGMRSHMEFIGFNLARMSYVWVRILHLAMSDAARHRIDVESRCE